jgi:hypothetical protein
VEHNDQVDLQGALVLFGGLAGSARCWVLRGHLLVGCLSLAAPGLDRLTHPWCRLRAGWVGVVVVVAGRGVVVC